MNEEAVQELINRKPELKSSRAKLESMQTGSYCIHRSWGFGKIRDFDAAEGKLIIDFDEKENHRMDPAFCVSTMEVLSPDHILVRKQTEPDVIKTMIDKKPADLVIELLKQYPNHAATGVEVESVLVRVVGEGSFKRWWTKAKKEVAKDPRVASPAKKTECFIVREEPVSVEDEILEDFSNTRSARRRISLAEKLVTAAETNKELKDSLGSVLESIAEVVKDSKRITDAERLHGAWVRDDLAAIAGRDPAGFQPSAASLIEDSREIPEIAEALTSHLHGRLLKLIESAHPVEWKDIIFNLLKLSHGKFTTDCISFLMERDLSGEIFTTLSRWQTEQNLRAPVLLWIVKNRNSKRFRGIIGELISPRLLSSIFFAIDYEALQSAGTRRIPLGEELSDDPDLINDLLAHADAETARDLANTLLLNQGFEELTKKSLLARFIKHFPTIQNLVAGENDEKEAPLLVSQSSFERRQKELLDIIQKKIPENSRAIGIAREHGDLRENSEFKMAKQDQGMLFARRAKLEGELARAQVTDFSSATPDQVGVGSIVTLHDEQANEDVTYTILGAWDSDPDNSIISYQTPLSASLLTRRVGDTVSVRIGDHERTVVVKEIRRYLEEAKV